MKRVTFALDEATVDRIRRTAARMGKPQSQIVREAVAEYAERAGQLSDAERRLALNVLERLRAQAPTRPASAVDRELRANRTARRGGGRRHPAA